jgi:hypothetical protein
MTLFLSTQFEERSQGSVVSIAGLWVGRSEFEFRQWQKVFPERLCSSPKLQLYGYRASFPVVNGRSVKLTTDLHLAPSLKISGVIPLPTLYNFIM